LAFFSDFGHFSYFSMLLAFFSDFGQNFFYLLFTGLF
jgi:hypothetical protein